MTPGVNIFLFIDFTFIKVIRPTVAPVRGLSDNEQCPGYT